MSTLLLYFCYFDPFSRVSSIHHLKQKLFCCFHKRKFHMLWNSYFAELVFLLYFFSVHPKHWVHRYCLNWIQSEIRFLWLIIENLRNIIHLTESKQLYIYFYICETYLWCIKVYIIQWIYIDSTTKTVKS